MNNFIYKNIYYLLLPIETFVLAIFRVIYRIYFLKFYKINILRKEIEKRLPNNNKTTRYY